MKLLTVVGARPQFVKAAMVSRAIATAPSPRIEERIVHTGQHYDQALSEIFFGQMGIPEPERNLNVGSGSHAVTTADMLKGIEQAILDLKPDGVLLYGDTNSTLAGALAAAKLHVPVHHVEAGLRSFNQAMPEEINRIVTDHVSTLLFCPTMTAVRNLAAESITAGVHHVGDVMYDAALAFGELAERSSSILERLSITPRKFFLVTCHRAENTDDAERLRGIFTALREIASASTPVILPIHPRTRAALKHHSLSSCVETPDIRIVPPVSFLDMVMLEKNAKVILTDSGGVQKEACFHGVPCVTMRDETEWVETVDAGWNQVVGAGADAIAAAVDSCCVGTAVSDFGDGTSAQKIVTLLAQS